MKAPYSHDVAPELKPALDEVLEVLKKHDVTAVIVLQRPGQATYHLHLEASHTGFKNVVEDGKEGVRIRIKKSELGKEEAERLARGTANCARMLTDAAVYAGVQIMELADYIDDKVGATHVDLNPESDGKQAG
jgi:hypothetical protein